MDTLYPGARWRPLSSQDPEPVIGVPRVLIVHTMVGYLGGTESMFRRDGYSGTESTFGLGGPADGPELDGVLYQWQTLNRAADAQYHGNPYATSVETSDGGKPSTPWSPKQLAALTNLIVWWCHQTGHPCQLVGRVTDAGIGYHEQFTDWNPNKHNCPGDVREKQLREVVIPRAFVILHPQPKPVPNPKPAPVSPAWPYSTRDWMGETSSNPRNHSGYYSKDRPGILQWQRQMIHRGWKGMTADGTFSAKDAAVAEAFAKQPNVRYKPVGGYGTVDKALFTFAWTKAIS